MIRKEMKTLNRFSPKLAQIEPNIKAKSPMTNNLQNTHNTHKIHNKINISPSVSNTSSLKTKNKEISVSPRPSKISDDSQNLCRFRSEVDDLGRRSSLEEVYEFIKSIHDKSKKEELSATQKYMLKGYADIYIQEAVSFNDIRDIGQLTAVRVKSEWIKICRIWELIGMKEKLFNVRRNAEKSERVDKSFEVLEQLMINIERSKNKLEPVWKLLKKLYFDILN